MTQLTALNMLIVHVLPRKHLFAALTMESLVQVDSDDVTVDRVLEHRFTRGATVPQTLDPAYMLLCVPFTNVSADTGSGANDPHPAGIARLCPVAFVDADHTGAGVEIILIDPQPFNVDGTGTIGASATCAFLLWWPITHDRSLSFTTDEVCAVFGRAWEG